MAFSETEENDEMLPLGVFEGKTALVTGGSAGIGKAVAIELARLGAELAIAARGIDRLQSILESIPLNRSKVHLIPCDITDPGQVKLLVDEVLKRFHKLDILVNSVGWGSIAKAEDLESSDWAKSIDFNLNGAFYVTQAAAQAMIQGKTGGSIVNVAASRGWNGSPNTVHIGSAKAAVLSMTKSLAIEWAKYGIRVNAVAPGGFETERQAREIWHQPGMLDKIVRSIPLKRIAKPEEAAWAISFLVSDFAGYITGEVLTIDGGWMLNQFAYLED